MVLPPVCRRAWPRASRVVFLVRRSGAVAKVGCARYSPRAPRAWRGSDDFAGSRWSFTTVDRTGRCGAADGETTNEAGPPAPPPIASPWAPQVDPPAATRVRASRRSGSVFACVLLSRGWRSTVRVVALPETRSPLHRRGRDGCFAGRVRCRGRARTRWLALLLLRPGVVHSWRVTCVGVRCIVHRACFRTLLGHELDVEERYRPRNDRVYRFFWRLGLFPADIRNQHGLRRVSV